jgi:flagellar basal-body rod protein FlgB
MIGDSITSALIQKALDGTWQRQKAISNNIANHETPGYKAVRVSFEQELKNQVQRLQNTSNNAQSGKSKLSEGLASIRNSKIRFSTDRSTSERADGNNVNLDFENIQMAKAQIQYQYLTRAITDYYARLRHAISEGKR